MRSKRFSWAWPMLLVLMTATGIAQARAANMPSVTIKVVDEQTGAPMQGVTAMLWQTAHQGNLSGHGGTRLVLFAVEATSDDSGELRFPRQQFDGPPLFSLLQVEPAAMLLLKPGFAPLVLDKEYHTAHGMKDSAVWNRPGASIAMTQTSPDRQRDQTLAVIIRTDQLLEPAGKCAWQHVPNTLATAHRMYPGYSTLVRLQDQDARYAQLGCESPLAFFKRYGVDRTSRFGVRQPLGVAKAAGPSQVSAAAHAAQASGKE